MITGTGDGEVWEEHFLKKTFLDFFFSFIGFKIIIIEALYKPSPQHGKTQKLKRINILLIVTFLKSNL